MGGSVGNVVLVLSGERAVVVVVVAWFVVVRLVDVEEEDGVERRLGGCRVQPGEMKT